MHDAGIKKGRYTYERRADLKKAIGVRQKDDSKDSSGLPVQAPDSTCGSDSMNSLVTDDIIPTLSHHPSAIHDSSPDRDHVHLSDSHLQNDEMTVTPVQVEDGISSTTDVSPSPLPSTSGLPDQVNITTS